MVRVKICGLTNYRDALEAIELGIDALGFIFAPSPRQVTPESVRDIVSAIPPFVKTVGVFVNEDPAEIKETVKACGLDLVQLHGDETPETCQALMPRVVEIVPPTLNHARPMPPLSPALDS